MLQLKDTKMSKRLEHFIQDNKKEFDLYDPPAELWDRIDSRLRQAEKKTPTEKVVRLSILLKVAATVFVVLTVGLLFWKNQTLNSEQVTLSSIDPQLAKQQVQYASLIEIKRTELKRIEKEEPELYKTFAAELKKMDSSYDKLKNELPESPNQERTVRAMIRNLEIQLEVLNQQLLIIQQINQFKKEQKDEAQII